MVEEEGLYLIKFYKDVSFLQKTTLLEMFNRIPEGSSLVLDGSSPVFVDEDIQDVIEEYLKRGSKTGIKIELKRSQLALCPLFKG
jgi:hypothetical protein